MWMKHYGHLCLKRTLLWSTSHYIREFDMGRICKRKHKSLVSTAKKYQDREGRVRYQGTRALKSTEFLIFGIMPFKFRLTLVLLMLI